MTAAENRETSAAQTGPPGGTPRLVYCHCKYARIIADDVKHGVLQGLTGSGVAFDAVADLCEMSARKDPGLARLAAAGPLKIAACYPRAVKWLFHAGRAPLPERGVEILNMRERAADEVLTRLLAPDLQETEIHSRAISEDGEPIDEAALKEQREKAAAAADREGNG